MATPAGDGIKGDEDDFPPLPPMDSIPTSHQIIIASILVACMIGAVVVLSIFLQALRRRGYFGNMAEQGENYESVFSSSRFSVGGRFMSLTERRRREEALLKNMPPVINLPIKSLHGTESMAWDKLQPVCAQFEEADEEESLYEDAKHLQSPFSSFEAKSPPFGGVLVGAIIMMPTMESKHTRGQPPVVHLEMMLGTSRV